MKTSDLYEEVTANIVRELEAGAIPWQKCWEGGDFFPHNAITKRPYSGVNVLILLMKGSARGYGSGEWLTFKQALAANACVRKGEKGTPVVFVKPVPGNEDEKGYTVLRTFSVFNRAQIDGLPEPEDKPPWPLIDGAEAAEKLVQAAQVVIRPGEPCYIPSVDEVRMPSRESFEGDEHYYATLLHECVHWTGAKQRLDRDMKNRFGSKEYAAEELVAELGAAFLCAHTGVKGELRHAGYIDHWLQLLKEDDRAIFTAAAKASQAANFLRSFSETEDILPED